MEILECGMILRWKEINLREERFCELLIGDELELPAVALVYLFEGGRRNVIMSGSSAAFKISYGGILLLSEVISLLRLLFSIINFRCWSVSFEEWDL